MSVTLTTPSFPFVRSEAETEGSSRPRGLTLEQRLEGSWHELRLRGAAECPLCRAPMHRAADGAGECTGCGSKLA
jgi:hypothetical protein